jgi:hypothetical protein
MANTTCLYRSLIARRVLTLDVAVGAFNIIVIVRGISSQLAAPRALFGVQ